MTSPARFLEIFRPDAVQIDIDAPRFNVAPSQDVPVIIVTEGQRCMRAMRWGLIPSWADDPSIGNRMINARAETAASKPSFRSAFRKRRCLILADGFYEWQKTDDGKQPMFIRVDGGDPFAFAGLFERWDKGEQGPIESCTIMTTEANAVLSPIHHRMPVILPEEHYATWLDPDQDNRDTLQAILQPFNADRMDAYPVSRYVNSPRNQGKQCVQKDEGGEE